MKATMNDYAIIVVRLAEEDGGGFLGFAPDLPGCMSDGDTRIEAVQNTELALEEWIVAQEARDCEIPEPGISSQEAEEQEQRLHDIIRLMAEELSQSEKENTNLKRKLAELIAVLRKEDTDKLPKYDVVKASSKLKPKRTH